MSCSCKYVLNRSTEQQITPGDCEMNLRRNKSKRVTTSQNSFHFVPRQVPRVNFDDQLQLQGNPIQSNGLLNYTRRQRDELAQEQTKKSYNQSQNSFHFVPRQVPRKIFDDQQQFYASSKPGNALVNYTERQRDEFTQEQIKMSFDQSRNSFHFVPRQVSRITFDDQLKFFVSLILGNEIVNYNGR